MNVNQVRPPSDLVREWSRFKGDNDFFYFEETFQRIADKAAQWGADRQLDLAIEYLKETYPSWDDVGGLGAFRKAMRPKPMSKKQRAKNALSQIMGSQKGMFDGKPFFIIKEALDSLPDD